MHMLCLATTEQQPGVKRYTIQWNIVVTASCLSSAGTEKMGRAYMKTDQVQQNEILK